MKERVFKVKITCEIRNYVEEDSDYLEDAHYIRGAIEDGLNMSSYKGMLGEFETNKLKIAITKGRIKRS